MSDMDLPLAVRMMQDGYLMQIDALQAENEELRKELAVTNPLFETLNDANDRLLAENAKLRELVRDMWTCIQTADKSDNAWDECDRCSLWNGNNNHRCEFDRRMKELGVEAE